MQFTGYCRCGQLRLDIEAPALPPVYACHCLSCQRWSGSAFALHMLCAAPSVHVTGEAAIHEHGQDGQRSTQYACAKCFTRLFNETTAAPGMRVVRAGVLEGAAQLAPVAHIWVRRKHPWISLPAHVAQWQESPTPEAFARVVLG
ncbi:aldehyde-activating protein [Pseudomonas sp. RtIB026]|uniref:GFA family protein n=1 Tax=Pseudomonas sp. RtIB026 TaxID=2749999 RepID=UPI0019424F55|nr:GFA family protein [Pseudomonas sp. RtIB026]BCJ06165.1 aldehyde-activating protein [Pseudomonas sp. RtIB026]